MLGPVSIPQRLVRSLTAAQMSAHLKVGLR
jgi:hypothetical protein